MRPEHRLALRLRHVGRHQPVRHPDPSSLPERRQIRQRRRGPSGALRRNRDLAVRVRVGTRVQHHLGRRGPDLHARERLRQRQRVQARNRDVWERGRGPEGAARWSAGFVGRNVPCALSSDLFGMERGGGACSTFYHPGTYLIVVDTGSY